MEEIQSLNNWEPEDTNGLSTGAKIGIGLGAAVGVILLILAIIFLLNNPSTTETIRDLFIIVLALETLVIGTLLVILVYQLITLIRLVREEIKPIIQSTQETVNTAKGTTTFVSERVTQPAIEAMSYLSGIGRSIRVLFRMAPSKGRSTSSPARGDSASEPDTPNT